MFECKIKNECETSFIKKKLTSVLRYNIVDRYNAIKQ